MYHTFLVKVGRIYITVHWKVLFLTFVLDPVTQELISRKMFYCSSIISNVNNIGVYWILTVHSSWYRFNYHWFIKTNLILPQYAPYWFFGWARKSIIAAVWYTAAARDRGCPISLLQKKKMINKIKFEHILKSLLCKLLEV